MMWKDKWTSGDDWCKTKSFPLTFSWKCTLQRDCMHGYDIPLVLYKVKGNVRGEIHSSRLPFALVGSLQLAREMEELFK